MEGVVAPPAVSDDDLKAAVASIVATADLQSMTKRSVLAELTSRHGEAAVAGRLDMVRATINEEIDKLSKKLAASAPPAENGEAAEVAAEEEEKPSAKKRAKAAPKPKKETKEATPRKKPKKTDDGAADAAADELPTNVEMDVDMDSIGRRRNPGRKGKAIEKPRKEKKAKKERDPSKPKRPGKMMQLSGPMQDFFGAPQGTRADVAAKVRAYIKEKDLQDPKDKRNILLEKDPEMAKLWPRQKKTTYFKINQLLTKHVFHKGEAIEDDEEDDGDEEEGGEDNAGEEKHGEEKKQKVEETNGANNEVKEAPVAAKE